MSINNDQNNQLQSANNSVDSGINSDASKKQQQAAADIIRAQLEAIYSGQNPHQAVSSAEIARQTTMQSQNKQPVVQSLPNNTGQAKQDEYPSLTANQATSAVNSAYAQTANHPLNQTAENKPNSVATDNAPSSIATQKPIEQADIAANPYERTYAAQPSQVERGAWKQYHSAWQDYYKKYYETYYAQYAAQLQQKNQANSKANQPTSPKTNTAFGSHKNSSVKNLSDNISDNSTLKDLRSKLLSRVEKSAKKVKKSRHFVPLAVTAVVLLAFGFLQYNQILIANVKAYTTPGEIDPQNIIVDPLNATEVGPENRLIIPKINVDAPVFYGVASDLASQNKAMENGVAQFSIPGADARPGEIGNTVLSGHSSTDVFSAGDYKYIFMQLNKLEEGDIIYANYEGKRYTYKVTKKEEVEPSQVDKLIYQTDKPVMTLITCTPLGTALRRLLVTAEQIYPAPSGATAAPAQSSSDEQSQDLMPSQSQPTLLERLFGAK